MRGAPGLMFCIAAVRGRIFTRVAATALAGAHGPSHARTRWASRQERVLQRSMAGCRNLMRI